MNCIGVEATSDKLPAMRRSENENLSSYPRMARRLRARLGNDLHLLHDSLQELARSYDSRHARQTVSARVFDPMDPPAYFAAMVRSQMTGPVLTYSARRHLIAQAARLGISRFHANLLIAATLHETGKVTRPAEPIRSSSKWLLTVFTAAAVQACIVLAVWMMLTT